MFHTDPRRGRVCSKPESAQGGRRGCGAAHTTRHVFLHLLFQIFQKYNNPTCPLSPLRRFASFREMQDLRRTAGFRPGEEQSAAGHKAQQRLSGLRSLFNFVFLFFNFFVLIFVPPKAGCGRQSAALCSFPGSSDPRFVTNLAYYPPRSAWEEDRGQVGLIMRCKPSFSYFRSRLSINFF